MSYARAAMKADRCSTYHARIAAAVAALREGMLPPLVTADEVAP